ncbi:MarR family winged helix-turn-helix transcriptional regulator [Pseudodesulfovibrio sediminis]|uniref:HTH marR-type domain-containing protein n=1 Tax=Pseudodesulfovibrio sediminis TaxID=2810563 RepID=A0ABM7P4J1_9BACT|nr:MarR family transcriptional regulator [Pseudodesulfovibrio sediminis]BCS87761.1 hypothetical protein PSDVSF_10030 [Pseudodesulfovibrio sediminis]
MTETNKNDRIDPVELAGLFRRASRTMARLYHRRDSAHHAQDHVLSIIKERGPINQGVLLEILDVRSSSLSEIIRKLERNGLVTRNRDERDRRSFVVSATEKAGALNTDLDNMRESADRLFTCLNAEEQTQLHAILEKIIQSLADDPLSQPGGRCCNQNRRSQRKGKGGGMGGRGFGRGGGRGRK